MNISSKKKKILLFFSVNVFGRQDVTEQILGKLDTIEQKEREKTKLPSIVYKQVAFSNQMLGEKINSLIKFTEITFLAFIGINFFNFFLLLQHRKTAAIIGIIMVVLIILRTCELYSICSLLNTFSGDTNQKMILEQRLREEIKRRQAMQEKKQKLLNQVSLTTETLVI